MVVTNAEAPTMEEKHVLLILKHPWMNGNPVMISTGRVDKFDSINISHISVLPDLNQLKTSTKKTGRLATPSDLLHIHTVLYYVLYIHAWSFPLKHCYAEQHHEIR